MAPVQIYYVLFLRKAIADVKARFATACSGAIEVLATTEEGHNKGGVVLECHTTDERPVPNPQIVAHFGRGFSAQSAATLAEAKAAISLTGVGPFDPQHDLLRELTRCVSRLARELDAVVFDAADWLTFTPKAFHDLRGAEVEAGELSCAQFGVRAYRVDGGVRSVSMGLEKFGQANFALTLFSEHQMTMMDRMNTLAMQHIIESNETREPGPLKLSIFDLRNPRVRQELIAAQQVGGSGRAVLQLETVAPLEGDPEVLLAPVFKAPAGPRLWAEQGALLKQLFGVDQHVSKNVHFGQQIQEAIQKARKEAILILSEPERWQQEGFRLRVAVGLPGVKEVGWLEVTRWQNGQGAGILLSQPQSVPTLKSGDSVSFADDDLMDYTLSNPEGELSSGGVDDLVRRLQGK